MMNLKELLIKFSQKTGVESMLFKKRKEKARGRPTVAIDCDDVILGLVESWVRYYNIKSGDSLKKEDITDWNISNFVKPDFKDEIYKYMTDMHISKNILMGASPYKDADRVLLWLMTYCDVYIVTATHYNNFASKVEWIKYFFPFFPTENIVVLSDKFMFNSEYLVDDKIDNVASFRGRGILFNQPWNKKYMSIFTKRVNDWLDIEKFFKRELSRIGVL